MTAARLRVGLAATLALLSWTGSAAASPTITEFPVPNHDRGPRGIVAGPDGALWFAQSAGGGGIGRSTIAGSFSEFSSGGIGTAEAIALGPDGNLWFTEPSEEAIAQITPTGTAKEFSLGGGFLESLLLNVTPAGIAAGPDGNLWFTISSNPAGIGRLTPEGMGTVFSSGLGASSKPQGIAKGPDGNLWFTETANPAKIGKITLAGAITEFSTGLTANSQPQTIAAGPEGNLWFTESADPGRIGRITPAGTITEFTTGLTTNSGPEGITAADDGNLYFTEFKGPGRIGRITPAGTITELATPTTNSQPEQIANGPDGNLWFTENGNHGQIARLTVAPSVGQTTTLAVSEQAASLQAQVGANSQATSYYFEYGPTTAYGSQSTSASAGSGASASPVTGGVSGLAPATLYHVRAVATNASGTTYGADQTFKTAPAPSTETGGETGGTAGASTPPAPGAAPLDLRFPQGLAPPSPLVPATAPAGAPIAPPALGHSAQLRPVRGRVLVRLPGTATPRSLEGAGDIPMGSWIDASRGVIALSTATDAFGHTQSATVWGGEFRVAQTATPPGRTTFTLRAPANCAQRLRRHAVRASLASRSRGGGAHVLWAKDNHGHFSTRGQNSVATVRGTYWETVDRCEGTLTLVRRGAVSVRDLHLHRTVLVGAGHRYLARR